MYGAPIPFWNWCLVWQGKPPRLDNHSDEDRAQFVDERGRFYVAKLVGCDAAATRLRDFLLGTREKR